MNKNAIDKLIELERVLVAAGEIERSDYWPGHRRKSTETDIEHSYFLAVISWQVANSLKIKLDHEKILKYALVHDLPEVYAGDTPLFANEDRKDRQAEKEMDAVKRLRQKLAGSDLAVTLDAFFAQADEESRFVSAMDKLAALLVHIVSEETQFVDNNIGADDIERALPAWRRHTDINPEMKAITDDLLVVWYRTVKLAEK